MSEETESIWFALENGSTYEANHVSGDLDTGAEVVFTTSYTGYEESLTDPSYREQALVFCYPQIGTYGLDARRFESDMAQPEIVIAREFTEPVKEWLGYEECVAVDGLDTRDIVKQIRDEGSMSCGVGETEYDALNAARGATPVSSITDIADRVGVDDPQHFMEENHPTVVIVDCGVKDSMIEEFVDRGCYVSVVPNDIDPMIIDAHNPDLLFVSNGPGDPKHYEHVIDTIDAFSGYVPVAGICLGMQLIALAHGGSTSQMKFGHRGSNQPIMCEDDTVRMTTQNHSFHVTKPGELEVVEYNVNDNSVEGLRGDGIRAVQFHPEAHPGPHDAEYFFDEILDIAVEGEELSKSA